VELHVIMKMKEKSLCGWCQIGLFQPVYVYPEMCEVIIKVLRSTYFTIIIANEPLY